MQGLRRLSVTDRAEHGTSSAETLDHRSQLCFKAVWNRLSDPKPSRKSIVYFNVMVSAINNIKVSHGHWKRGASDLDLYEVRPPLASPNDSISPVAVHVVAPHRHPIHAFVLELHHGAYLLSNHNVQAVQELLENAMYAEGKSNATEAHIYTLKVRVGPNETKEVLIIRDNGTGISSTFFAEEASSLGHTRGYTAKHLVDKKGLGRHGGDYRNYCIQYISHCTPSAV